MAGLDFLFGYRGDGAQLPYLATCRHVAAQLKKDFYIRVNTTALNVSNPRSHVLPVTAADWVFPEDETVDLAVTHLNLNNAAYDVVYLVLNDMMAERDIECGDPVSIVGLFRLHAGSKKNMPIVHTGNVALLPDPREKIPLKDTVTGRTVEVEGYLVEAQTLQGLSGSPVFVREFTRLRPSELTAGEKALAFGDVSFLGVYSGAWDGDPGEILAADRGLRGDFRVPVGMGVVVPGPKLERLLREDTRLKKQRQDYADERKKGRAAKADEAFPVSHSPGAKSRVAGTDSAFPATDENPKHREDFNSLLGAAVKKPVRED